MRVVVVYESLFGNTHVVAQAVAQGVQDVLPEARVTCVPVAAADAAGADLLVVGGPTHASETNRAAARGLGVRDWVKDLDRTGAGRAAAFDTRVDKPLPIHAARGIGRLLRRAGYVLVAAPEGFLVEAVAGPLCVGERERARAWGAGLTAPWSRGA